VQLTLSQVADGVENVGPPMVMSDNGRLAC
jgi:hypothetical protein